MKKSWLPVHHLELRVSELMQLFNSLDPTPFLNKDLDRSAEAFIEIWALGFPPDSRLQITIHLEHLPAEGNATILMTEASRARAMVQCPSVIASYELPTVGCNLRTAETLQAAVGWADAGSPTA